MKIFAHFKTIKDDPGKFILWLLTSVILSLSTVWLPSFVGMIADKTGIFEKLMANNPFIIFSVVFLSNAILTAVNYKGAGTTNFAVAMRGITLVITILYLLLLSSIIPLKMISDISLTIKTQFILLSISIAIGIYVYGFREATWESSVDEVRAQQDREVGQITDRANNIANDGNEIAL